MFLTVLSVSHMENCSLKVWPADSCLSLSFCFFFEVLGLPSASKIPQYPSLPGSRLEGKIHGE